MVQRERHYLLDFVKFHVQYIKSKQAKLRHISIKFIYTLFLWYSVMFNFVYVITNKDQKREGDKVIQYQIVHWFKKTMNLHWIIYIYFEI